MDPTSFGSLIGAAGGGAGGGGLSGMLAKAQVALRGTSMAPPVPADGAMQPTIGPGMAAPAPAAPAYQPKLGLPKGGILGLLQGQTPQGIAGLLQHFAQSQGAPLAGGMPPAGMIQPQAVPQQPIVPQPVTPPAAGLPTNITPDNQF
jgi:hypothetical protein